MIKVIDIKFKPNKKSADVLFDDGQIINLDCEIIVKNSIYKESNIEENILKKAIWESQKKQALDKSINYLSKGYRSERQLKKYLKEKKYVEEIQKYVIEKLKEYNYINDESLSNLFVQSSQNKMGINKIKQKLYEKGIHKKIIENSLLQINNQDMLCDELCQKKWKSLIKNKRIFEDNNEEYKYYQNLKAKLSRFLFSQGFEWDTIKTSIRAVMKDKDLECE